MHTRTAVSLPLVAAALLLGTPTAAADVVRPIGPDQSFVGVVHGTTGVNRITVDCPGPLNFGHPAAGQTVAVVATAAVLGGYTGRRADAIAVAFPGSPSTVPLLLRAYVVPDAIPTTLNLPCTGRGVVRFVPVPTSKSARADLVPVTFVPGPTVGP